MSAPSVGSPRLEAMLDAVLSRDPHGDDYWEDISVLVKEASNRILRPFFVDRCRRITERGDARSIVCILDVLVQLEEPVVRLATSLSRHADDSVRHAVAGALEDSRDPLAIETLASLCRDKSPRVRAAAVGAIVRGLGVPSDHDFVDAFVIRDALAACLDAEDRPVRDMAILGLAMRKDARARAPLARLVSSDELTGRLVDAAYHLAAPELAAALRHQIDMGSDVGGDWSLAEALAACTVDRA